MNEALAVYLVMMGTTILLGFVGLLARRGVDYFGVREERRVAARMILLAPLWPLVLVAGAFWVTYQGVRHLWHLAR